MHTKQEMLRAHICKITEQYEIYNSVIYEKEIKNKKKDMCSISYLRREEEELMTASRAFQISQSEIKGWNCQRFWFGIVFFLLCFKIAIFT